MASVSLYAYLSNPSWNICPFCRNIQNNRRRVCVDRRIFFPFCYYGSRRKLFSLEYFACSSIESKRGAKERDESILNHNQYIGTKRVVKRIVRERFQEAKKAENKGNWKLAIELLRQCLDLDLTDAHSWLALAKLMMKHCFDTEEIRCLLNEAIKHCSENVRLLHVYAVFEYKSGFPNTARQLFRKGLSIETDNGYIYQAWGLMEQRLGNIERARELFHECLQKSSNLEVFIALGILEAKCGYYQKSRNIFEMALLKLNTIPPEGKVKRRRTSWNAKAGLYRAWANVEESCGNMSLAMELLSKAVSECPVESETYFALAKLEYKRRNWLDARKWVQLAETVGGTINVAIYSFWAILEEKLNNVDIARHLLDKASRIYVADCSVVQTWATLEQRAGNMNKARELFQKSIDIRPNAPAFVAWALMEERESNFETARILFQRALLVDKLHSPTYNAYALYEARQGNLQAARAILEDGMRNVFSPCILHGYAQLELKYFNDTSRAKQLLLEGTKCVYEDNSFVWHSLGHLELSQKNYKDAIYTFQQGISRYPRNSLLHLGLALSYVAVLKEPGLDAQDSQARMQFLRLTRTSFEKAIECDPFHAHAWQAWGIFELAQGKYEVARELLKRGIRNCPSHVALWQSLGLLEAQNGSMHRAREIFKHGSLLPLGCSHVRLYHTWACCELRVGDVEEARRLLEEALKCDNTHGPVWNVYGMLEEHHGSISRARELFEEGIQQAPKHMHLYISYALFEYRQGNDSKANELFHLAFQIDPHSSHLKETYSKFSEILLSNRSKSSSSYVEMQKKHSRIMSHVNYSWLDVDLLLELESPALTMDAFATRRYQS
ncbi:hypothetical protein GpartN1_g829.t1 [Galdieria partita]|uniref:PsbB mRNA maturation factor Mbb1 n=1 Tax=Galdieria partita TaxID=83374 RepID=A0A9C7UMW5_9RHOD|nr:hypothetical protein GpartN1_g829.t1 [Galdieria partita]